MFFLDKKCDLAKNREKTQKLEKKTKGFFRCFFLGGFFWVGFFHVNPAYMDHQNQMIFNLA